MGPTQFNGSFGESELRHLLRRTMYGATTSDVQSFQGQSMEQVVDALLADQPWPSPPVNNYAIEVVDPHVAPGEVWVDKASFLNENGADQAFIDARNGCLQGWMIKQMIAQTPTIRHKMTMFWHNHFGNSIGFVSIIKMSYQYFRTIWQLALGDFNDLIKAMTIDPHMLIFLNGAANIKEAPDENYARELQELYVIGKGPNAAFTEGDVQEAARVLTGWSVDWDTVFVDGEVQSRFFDFQHETRNKSFSSFYNNQVIQGRSGSAGADETDILIRMMIDHPECARFICRKLYRFFIHQELTPQVESDFIEPLAEVFIDSNYDIRSVLRSLFVSDHFYSEKVRGALIKSPLDVMVGFWRTAEVAYPEDGDPLAEDYYTHLMMMFGMADMGFLLGEPPSVSGWPAYHQFPSYDKLWLTTFSLISRILVTDAFVSDGFWTPLRRIPWDYLAYTASLPDPGDPGQLVEDLVNIHLPQGLPLETKTDLKNILLSGQATDSYWTNAWFDYVNDPGDDMKKEIVRSRLQFLYLSFFQLPEYQLF